MPLMIYEEQEGYLHEARPYNYLPEDVVYRLPWLMAPRTPPLRILYNVLLPDGSFDPYAVYVGRTPEGLPFAYNPRHVVNPLILVVGTPGAGKSATLMTLLHSIITNEVLSERRAPPIIVVDPEGEYSVLGSLIGSENMLHIRLGRGHYINIFDRPSKNINPIAWYTRLLTVIQEFLGVTPAQAAQAYRVLKRALLAVAKSKGLSEDPATWYRDDITLEDIYNWIRNQVETLEKKGKMTRAERLFYTGAVTLLTRLDQWMIPPNDAFSRKSTFRLSDMFNYKLVVLDARGLASSLFGLFTYWITYWIYGLLLEKGPLPEFGIRLVLAIDEAWALLKKRERREENPLEALARRGRKYGVLIIVATQTPEDVDEKMYSLFGTVVTGIIPSEKMARKLAESRSMPQTYKTVIKGLERGMLVWSINWNSRDFPMSRMPILVHTDYPIRRVKLVSHAAD